MVQHLVGDTQIFSVTMEENDQLIRPFEVWQVQTWDVVLNLNQFGLSLGPFSVR